jgi:microcystin-dependent protein
MAYVDSTNYNKTKSMKGFPVGSIVPWSGQIDSIPYGWILCGGSTPPVSRYPLLYEAIGNVYGGTPGSSFKLPNLNDGSSAIMDIYRGHFEYLQTAGAADKPENANITRDSFWQNVGIGDNGNRPGNTQLNWLSTIDIVGEQISKPDIVAAHGDFALSEGDIQYTISPNERKLSDRHVPDHSHDYEADEPVSYARTNDVAAQYQARFDQGPSCVAIGTATTVTRSTNDPPVDGTQMASVGASISIGTNYRAGGGDIINDGLTFNLQERATGFSNGDGFSGGDMWSHRNGTRYFWTSLSHAEKSFSEIPGHTHGSLQYNFVSKLKIINPGIVTNVKMNTVTISNTPGVNFGSINMSSATPTCAMIFIIKAF